MTTRSSQDRFRILFEHSSDPHFIFNETGITDCNEAMVKILGCKDRSEVFAIHPARLSPLYQPDGQLSAEKQKKMDMLALRNGYHRFEWVHQRTNGETFPVEVVLNMVEIDDRPAMVAVWHDLTHIKRTEEELRRLNDRMRRELEEASLFQRSLLPSAPPVSDGFETAWFYKPCDELGGDSLNIFQMDGERIGLYVLDVTGHGVTSSLLSVAATHCLSGFFGNVCPHEVATGLNKHFAKEQFKDHTFTIVYGILDLKKKQFHYTSAGHLGPIVVKKDGRVERFDSHGPPVGILEDIVYERTTIPLEAGDRLFLLSDGVYEARDPKREEFGIENVLKHLSKEAVNGYSLSYTVNSLARAAYHWCIPSKPDDDISIVGVALTEPSTE